ncbi:glycoside hydrolase family 3 N-terminal domain-containing protein (plasmid) [Novosphingobium sp. BL-8A]|uniref:glycoside hydrolase family 3 N-terminal domain-containing protein n=1 Tax=Novosphingobium sp. BL-8A TaxID=3127639 RepID=UPI003756838C
MNSCTLQRRAFLLGSSMVAVWMSSPGRAFGLTKPVSLPSERVRSLIARMTLEEKAGQLTLAFAAYAGAAVAAHNPAQAQMQVDNQREQVRGGLVGGIFNGRSIETSRAMQTAALASRLGIPLIFGADVIHGYRTIFPVPLGEAASFEPSLCERTARAAAIEASADGLDWTFAPMVDIARDARWGRSVEGSGEDVLLGSDIAAARVRGFQGRSLRDADAILACPKHFAAYGAGESGLDYNAVDMSELRLRETYLPPFKAAFDAGALSTMAAFNEINGVPCHANRWLLDGVLRKEWGFEGLVVSDFNGDLELIKHGIARDERDAARLAIMAGVDLSMASGIYLKHLPDLVAKGEVPTDRLDQAVARVLTVKERLGLFDDPFRRLDLQRAKKVTGTPAHVALAREAASKSIVMLKNEGTVLPLPRSGKKIALIGPFSEGPHDLVGPWTVFGTDQECVDLATGMRAAMSDPTLLTVTQGSSTTIPLDGGIEAAVAAAKEADVVVLALGEHQRMSGEASSRGQIVIPEPQQRLAEAVAATGKPIVVLLKNGRALVLEGAVAEASAILVTWFLGAQTGHAIADILFGKASPSGRLPVSFPRDPGQLPYYYAHKPTGRPAESKRYTPFTTRFIGLSNTALYPFGHGLTYGDIAYEDIAVISANDGVTVGALISNRGARAATEVVQLYVQIVTASLTQPVRELKAYRKIELAAGGSQRVSFQLRKADLEIMDADHTRRFEAGTFKVWVAPSAEADGVSGSFKL